MCRRIVPATFWVGILVCASLSMASVLRASGPPRRVPHVRGVWDGFFIAADGTLGGVQSDIARQDFRRLAGDSVLFDLETGDLFNAYNFRATVPRDDFLTGTGVTRTGRLVFQAGLEFYAPQPPVVAFQTSPEPRAGNAAVMYPEFHLVPSRGGANRVSALLLHPFSGGATPDISGTYRGPFVSLADPITGNPPDLTFRGIGQMQISPRDRGSFAGRVDLFLDPDQPPIISWPVLATSSGDRRVIWLSQGAAGRILYDGVVVPAPDAESESFRLDGVFRLFFNDGRTLFNAYNCPIISR